MMPAFFDSVLLNGSFYNSLGTVAISATGNECLEISHNWPHLHIEKGDTLAANIELQLSLYLFQ